MPDWLQWVLGAGVCTVLGGLIVLFVCTAVFMIKETFDW